MKKLIVLVFSMFFAALSFAQTAKDDFTGKWKTEDGVTITISNNNGKISGLDPKGRPTLYNVRFEKRNGREM